MNAKGNPMKILLSWRFLVVVLLVVISMVISIADVRNSESTCVERDFPK